MHTAAENGADEMGVMSRKNQNNDKTLKCLVVLKGTVLSSGAMKQCFCVCVGLLFGTRTYMRPHMHTDDIIHITANGVTLFH